LRDVSARERQTGDMDLGLGTITYVVESELRPEGTWFTSQLASARYRVAIPSKAIKAAAGTDIRVTRVEQGVEIKKYLESIDAGSTVIVSKSFLPQTAMLAEAARAKGAKVVVDFCDDHFDHPALGSHFRNLAKLADVIVAATHDMAETVRSMTGRAAHVVGDPYEGPGAAPRFEPAPGDLRLVWFGHPTNLDTLPPLFREFDGWLEAHPDQRITLTLVTQADKATRQLVAGAVHRRLTLDWLDWSPQATWQALAASDAVVIPSLDKPKKLVKSANRLIEGIHAGRLVLAHPLPAYLPYREGAWVDGSISAGLDWALANPDLARARIAHGQNLVEQNVSPAAIAKSWISALEQIGTADDKVTTAGERLAGDATMPVRLNLGCGDKILPGYVNVDGVVGRAGKKPDIMCDLHHLEPIADASADEVMAIHVVGHFWRWEVVAVLKEWMRVLKPGGRMILECPNLLSACEAILKNPTQAAGPGPEGQRSMWVLYGDPSWKNPVMSNRWSYTPQSLAAIMAEAGFVKLRQEPAQYKLREPRDMRIVGERPDTAGNISGA
jgi:hypothetical protein